MPGSHFIGVVRFDDDRGTFDQPGLQQSGEGAVGLAAGVSQAFDVFLSHNSRDKPAVREIAGKLRERGLRVWLDEWELVPGRPWQEALEEVIETVGSAAVLVGRDGLGPWQVPEMRACLTKFVERKLPVIPVLLPGAPQRPELPLLLREFTWVDLRRGLDKEGLDRLVWGIRGSKPSSVGPRPRYENDEVRGLSVRLEQAYQRMEWLVGAGEDTTAVQEEILRLRREIRKGGQLRAGDMLGNGRFQLLEREGRGGFATVWRGYDRVIRGGCWFYYAWLCRSASRAMISPGYRDGSLGFRLVRTAE